MSLRITPTQCLNLFDTRAHALIQFPPIIILIVDCNLIEDVNGVHYSVYQTASLLPHYALDGTVGYTCVVDEACKVSPASGRDFVALFEPLHYVVITWVASGSN